VVEGAFANGPTSLPIVGARQFPRGPFQSHANYVIRGTQCVKVRRACAKVYTATRVVAAVRVSHRGPRAVLICAEQSRRGFSAQLAGFVPFVCYEAMRTALGVPLPLSATDAL
jgi:hypothetical protein